MAEIRGLMNQLVRGRLIQQQKDGVIKWLRLNYSHKKTCQETTWIPGSLEWFKLNLKGLAISINSRIQGSPLVEGGNNQLDGQSFTVEPASEAKSPRGWSEHFIPLGPIFPDNIKLWLKFETEINFDVKVKQNVVKWQKIMSLSLCMDLPDLISDEKISRRQGPFALWKCHQVIFGSSREFWIITCSPIDSELLFFSTFLY